MAVRKNSQSEMKHREPRQLRETYGDFTLADFFAGSGLVTEALKDTFRVVWANDISERKAAIYCANHSSEHFHLGPIQSFNGKDLPSVNLSWASFPCQDLSLAGKITGIHSSRSGLVWEWLRVLDESSNKPWVLALENVIGLVSAHRGADYLRLHEALVFKGYRVGAVMLDAVHWVPQSRPRVFVIAVRKDITIPSLLLSDGPRWCHTDAICHVAKLCLDKSWLWWNIPEPMPRAQNLSSIVDWDAPWDSQEKTDHRFSLIPRAHREALYAASFGKQFVFPGYRRTRKGHQVLELRFDDVAGCLRTPGGGSSRQILVLRDKRGKLGTRLLTVREAARLMGAPEGYRLLGTYNDGYMAMGDAVAVPAVRWLGRYLLYPLCQAARKKEEPYVCMG